MGAGPGAQEAKTEDNEPQSPGPTNPTDGGKSPRKHTDPTCLFLYWLGSRCAQYLYFFIFFFLCFGLRSLREGGPLCLLDRWKEGCFYTAQPPDVPMVRF